MNHYMRNMLVLAMVVLFAGGAIAGQKPSFNLDYYGYVKLDAAYDQNLTSHGNFTMWVQPQGEEDDEQFNMTHKQTRFGLQINGDGYENAMVGGRFEVDFYGGTDAGENKATILLRHAYLSFQLGDVKFVAGQTSDMISPLNPSTINYSVLWGIGNTGYRRPQISMYYTPQVGENTQLTLGTGFFRTIGDDLTPTFSLALGEDKDGADDGTDAGIPTIQGLLEVKHQFGSEGYVRVGGSGLWGQLKAETNMNRSDDYEAWGGCGHLEVKFNNQFGFSGEGYVGNNMGSYFGGILNSSTIEGVESVGGWGYLWVKPASYVKLSAGGGMDAPKEEDLTAGQRSKNTAFFGNAQFTILPNVVLAFEGMYQETEYLNADKADNFRGQTAFMLNF